ncbi:MAG: sodium/proline symporter [Acidobacteria bacterium]|nr:sodium/proline symporter [Acidobacteriota bacterium]
MKSSLFGLILYLLLMLGIGLWAWRKNKTKEDFILGGRRLGAWVIAFSERTAAESAWLLLGLSGAVYLVGLGEIWTVFGCVTGIILSWFIIAKRIRIRSEEYDAITLPELFYKAVGGSKYVRLVSMLIIVFFYSFYLSAQFAGAGKVLNITFNLDYTLGMAIGAFIIIAYTLMGGFIAVCYTDVFQAILMIITLVFLPILGFVYLSEYGHLLGPALIGTGNAASMLDGKTGLAVLALVIGGLSWGFGYMGQPHLVTKFMAIRSADEIKKSRTIATVWTIVAYSGAVMIGLVGIAMIYHGHIDISSFQINGKVDTETVLPVLTNFLFPAWIAGILISGAVAAMMSTADSQLLIATSTVVEDFYSKALNRKLSQRKLVFLSRLVTLLVGTFALLLAFTTENIIYKMVTYAWAGLGASFGPALLMILYWKKTNSWGVVSGMITGAVTTVVWTEISALDKMVSVRFVSFVLAFAAVIIGTLLKERKYGKMEPSGSMN